MARQVGSKNKNPRSDKGIRRKQFCVNGHDTFICGRSLAGACNQCQYNRRKNPSKDSRTKQFCPQGHDTFITGRNLSSACIVCVAEQGAKRYLDNKDEITAKNKKWRDEHQEEVKEQKQDYYIRNKERIDKRNKEYNEAHKEEIKILKAKWKEEHKEELKVQDKIYREEHKEEIAARMREYERTHKEQKKRYRAEHPEMVHAVNLKHETNRGLRVPKWADWENINPIIKNKPEGMAVDHFIPLQGRKVSGFHVSWNLQYLTIPENASKHNKANLLEISEWYGKILQQVGLK